jgi:hypothetical protein
MGVCHFQVKIGAGSKPPPGAGTSDFVKNIFPGKGKICRDDEMSLKTLRIRTLR